MSLTKDQLFRTILLAYTKEYKDYTWDEMLILADKLENEDNELCEVIRDLNTIREETVVIICQASCMIMTDATEIQIFAIGRQCLTNLLNFIHWSDEKIYVIECSRNFAKNFENAIRFGIWHSVLVNPCSAKEYVRRKYDTIQRTEKW